MCDDPACYLARRFSVLYEEDVAAACEARGFLCIERPRLGAAAYFLAWPAPAVVLGPRASPRARRHELAHAWLHEAREYGIDYEPPAWEWDGDEEAAAERFAGYAEG